MPKLTGITKTVQKLSADVAVAATTIYVEDATEFGSTYFTPPFALIIDEGTTDAEVVMVTAVTEATNALTVERDMFGTTDVAHYEGAKVREYGKYIYVMYDIEDVSTAEINGFVPPRSILSKISTNLEGTIKTADAVITFKKGTQAITNGAVTIAYSGSAAKDLDHVYPTAYNEFNGTTDVLQMENGGASENAVSVGVTLEFITLED